MAGKAVATKKEGGAVGKTMTVKQIQEQMAAESAGMKEQIGAPGANVIKLKRTKEFEFPDGTKAETFVGVVTDFVSRNVYYESKFDENNPQPPECVATGRVLKDMVPQDDCPDKQADNCATCPMNQFGSDGNGKACKNQRRLAILPPDATEDDDIMVMTVSPTALKRFDAVVSKTARELSATPIAVQIEFGFDESVDYPSLTFTVVEPNENLGEHWGRRDEAREILEAPVDFSALEEAPAKKKPARKAPAKRTASRARRS
jgi:hypothetical protein